MDIDLIWVGRKQKYFCKWGWTGKSLICPSGKSDLTCFNKSRESEARFFICRHSGARRSLELGIHNHERENGFRACASVDHY